MITINFVARKQGGTPTTSTIQCKTGISLMQAAVDANVAGIEADCGGLLTCATCHVIVPEPWLAQLPAASGDEKGMLDFTASPQQPGSRLSCQIQLTPALDGLTVELPDSQH